MQSEKRLLQHAVWDLTWASIAQNLWVRHAVNMCGQAAALECQDRARRSSPARALPATTLRSSHLVVAAEL